MSIISKIVYLDSTGKRLREETISEIERAISEIQESIADLQLQQGIGADEFCIGKMQDLCDKLSQKIRKLRAL